MKQIAPFVLFGIPLPYRQNPVLIGLTFSNLQATECSDEPFLRLAEEATGLKMKRCLKAQTELPSLTQYVVESYYTIKTSLEEENIEISKDEIWEILDMIDSSIGHHSIIKGFRWAQRLERPILFREGEEPITVELPFYTLDLMTCLDLGEPTISDDSFTHVIGIVPIKYAETMADTYVSVENGLWYSIYRLPSPYPLLTDLKWIWDSRKACLVSIREERKIS